MTSLESLIAALRDPACYPHPVDRVEVVETHISWVLLAGDYAYKLKKPVQLPFLDFRALSDRHRFCDEELRLNRRTAPELYLAVVPVAQTPRGPEIGGPGEPIEYAVKMRRFPDTALAESMAQRGELRAPQIDTIAAALDQFHNGAAAADAAQDYGTPARIAAPALANFEQLAALNAAAGAAAPLRRLRAWTARESERLGPAFAARLAGGRVRECHGDLHLGNIAFVDDRALLFDCIEFDPQLRWIDVVSEVAFLVMDLHAHGLGGLGWRLLNAWLEASGDYDGLRVLRFYLVYRAMVRAKIAGIRGSADALVRYTGLAETLARKRHPALLLMHGLSGSGKSTVAQAFADRAGGVRVRSDVERKRAHGLARRHRQGAAPAAGIYDAESTRRTYALLEKIAGKVLEAGYTAVVDAAFLRREQRAGFRRLAGRFGAPCVIAHCIAPEETLRTRLARRALEDEDASDASGAVLDHQLIHGEPLDAAERSIAVDIGTATAAGVREGVDKVASRLFTEAQAPTDAFV